MGNRFSKLQMRRGAKRIQKELESYRVGFLGILFLATVSCVSGVIVYVGLIGIFYGNLFDASLQADVLDDSFSEIPASGFQHGELRTKSDVQLTSAQVFSLLQYHQLLDDEERSPKAIEDKCSPSYLVNLVLTSMVPDSLDDPVRPRVGLVWRTARFVNLADEKFFCKEDTSEASQNSGQLAQTPSANVLQLCNDDQQECHRYLDALLLGAVAQLPSRPATLGYDLGLESKLDSNDPSDRLLGLWHPKDSPDTFGLPASILTKLPAGVIHALHVVRHWRVTEYAARIAEGLSPPSFVFYFQNGMFYRGYWHLFRPEPEASPEQIAKSVLQWYPARYPTNCGAKCNAQRKKLEQFLAVLISRTRGSSGVRDARIWVNGIIGWERLAVIVLFIYFSLRLLQRQWIGVRQQRAKNFIKDELEQIAKEGVQWQSAGDRIKRSELLMTDIAEHAGTIPYGVVEAADGFLRGRQSSPSGGASTTDNYVAIKAAQELQYLDGTRTDLDILLPTFPAIGFIGTVSSLLVAMSQADRIVSTTDPFAKGLAASQVTDILSLCFSTTFMALCAVLVFSVLSGVQQAREHSLVTEVQRYVEIALRPGQ